MRAKMVGRLEVHSAGMTGGGTEAHFRRHFCVGYFILDSPGDAEGRHPRQRTSRRKIDVTVEGTFVRIFLLLERVVMIGQKSLRRRYVDLAFVLRHQLLPTQVPRIGA